MPFDNVDHFERSSPQEIESLGFARILTTSTFSGTSANVGESFATPSEHELDQRLLLGAGVAVFAGTFLLARKMQSSIVVSKAVEKVLEEKVFVEKMATGFDGVKAVLKRSEPLPPLHSSVTVGILDSTLYKGLWHNTSGVPASSLVYGRKEATKKAIERLTDQFGLPPLRTEFEEGVSIRGAAAYNLGKGKVVFSNALFENPSRHELADIIAHETTHAEQDFLVVRRLADLIKIGSRPSVTETDLLARVYTKKLGVQPDPEFLNRALSTRGDLPLTREQALRANDLIDSNRALVNSYQSAQHRSIEIEGLLQKREQFGSATADSANANQGLASRIQRLSQAVQSDQKSYFIRRHEREAYNVGEWIGKTLEPRYKPSLSLDSQMVVRRGSKY